MLPFRSSGVCGRPKAIRVSLTVTAPATTPILQITPSSLSFSGVQGGANPAAQAFSISNGGSGTLTWTANESSAWLSLSSTSGTAPASVLVTADLTGLTPGSYADTITITPAGIGNPQTVAVILDIQATNSPGDAYETDNTCDQARPIATNGTLQEHSFHTATDEDWIRFDAVAGTTYHIIASVPPTSPADLAIEQFEQCSGAARGAQDYAFSAGVNLTWAASASGPIFLRFANHGATSSTSIYNLSIQSDTANIGALILVAGRYSVGDPLQSNIHTVADRVYQFFRARGYSDAQITYLAHDMRLSGVDAPPTVDSLAAAITTWANDKVGPSQPLTLYLIDHGDYDRFYLDKPGGQWITPAQLDGWVTQLETANPGLRVTIIVESCQSGSFIDPEQRVSKPGRIVISSTGAKNNAYAANGGAVFSNYFLAALERGESIYRSFQSADWAVRARPADQTPWLDDNGDGVPNNEGDGRTAQVQTYPSAPGTTVVWPPYVAQIAKPITVTRGMGTFRAQVFDDTQVARVWVEIYAPSYQPPAAGAEMISETIPEVNLTVQSEGWYTANYTGFQEAGVYHVVFYAEDAEGNRAQPVTVDVTLDARVFLPLLRR